VVEEPKPARPGKIVVKRRDLASEDDLRKQLLKAPEVNLDYPRIKQETSGLILQTAARLQPNQPPHFTPTLLVKRQDLTGLPWRMGADCQLGKEPAENLHAQSRKMRTLLAEATNDGNNLVAAPGGRVNPQLAAALAAARRQPAAAKPADLRQPSDKLRDKL